MSAYTQKSRSGSSLLVTVLCTLTLVAVTARAACINRYTHAQRGPEHIMTLLTGKLSFQDAQALAAAIRDGKAAPLEWVDTNGTTIAKQFGELKVVRPMPVACDSNASGVVMVASFATVQSPGKKILVKLGPKTVVEFEEQAN